MLKGIDWKEVWIHVKWVRYWPGIKQIRHFFQNLWHVIIWIPVIWQDRDWDEDFLFRIIHYKIKRMRLHFRDEGIVETKQMCDQLQEVEDVLAQVLKGSWSYIEKEQEELDKKYGELQIVYDDPESQHKCSVHVRFKPDSEEYHNEVKRLFLLEEERYTADIAKAFDLIKKNCRSWWS